MGVSVNEALGAESGVGWEVVGKGGSVGVLRWGESEEAGECEGIVEVGSGGECWGGMG